MKRIRSFSYPFLLAIICVLPFLLLDTKKCIARLENEKPTISAEIDLSSPDEKSHDKVSLPLLQRVTPSLDWLLDPSGKITLEEILTPANQRLFSSFLFTKLPKQEGTFWFRFTIDSTNRLGDHDIILDLNRRIPEQFPGHPLVWVSIMGSGKGKPAKQIDDNSYFIPNRKSEILEVYIQMPGAPGFGFSPVLWAEQSYSRLYTSISDIILVLLISSMAICILRSAFEKQEWRIWAALYIGAILISILWGLPQTPEGNITVWDIPGLLAPSIALFILPHLGRKLMQTCHLSTALDTQLLLLTFPGLILSLEPLIPGLIWTLPYLSLWPLVPLIFIPTALTANFRNLPNSKIFLILCCLPPLSMINLILPIEAIPQNISTPILNIFPLALLGSSGIILAIIRKPKLLNLADTEEEIIQPLIPVLGIQNNIQNNLRSILKQVSSLNRMLYLTPLQQHVESIEHTIAYITHLVGKNQAILTPNPNAPQESFDLHQLLLGIHGAVEKEAETKNLALSWFIAPHLAKTYIGNKSQLAQTIYLLIESAIQSTNKGLVQLRVQRASNSTNPGHLLITVSDSGHGASSSSRSSLALTHAWEMATSTGGSISMKSEPTGTSISFSICLTAQQLQEQTPLPQKKEEESFYDKIHQAPRIIITDTIEKNREILAYYLDELPYAIFEEKDCTSLYERYKKSPGALIIFGPNVDEQDIIKTVADIRVFEGEYNFPLAPIIALCKTEAHVEKCIRIGCTHTLLEPVERKELRHLTLRLAPISKRIQALFNKKDHHSSTADKHLDKEPSTVLNQEQNTSPDNALLQIQKTSSSTKKQEHEPVTTLLPKGKKDTPNTDQLQLLGSTNSQDTQHKEHDVVTTQDEDASLPHKMKKELLLKISENKIDIPIEKDKKSTEWVGDPISINPESTNIQDGISVNDHNTLIPYANANTNEQASPSVKDPLALISDDQAFLPLARSKRATPTSRNKVSLPLLDMITITKDTDTVIVPLGIPDTPQPPVQTQQEPLELETKEDKKPQPVKQQKPLPQKSKKSAPQQKSSIIPDLFESKTKPQEAQPNMQLSLLTEQEQDHAQEVKSAFDIALDFIENIQAEKTTPQMQATDVQQKKARQQPQPESMSQGTSIEQEEQVVKTETPAPKPISPKDIFNELTNNLNTLKASINKGNSNPEALMACSQAILNLSKQLKLHSVIALSQRFERAIVNNEKETLENLLLYISSEIKQRKANYINL